MQKAIVNFGTVQVEGLMLDNGEFAISVQEIARIYNLNDDELRKHIKIGVDIVSLSFFADLTRYLAEHGNRTAQSVFKALFIHGLKLFLN